MTTFPSGCSLLPVIVFGSKVTVLPVVTSPPVMTTLLSVFDVPMLPTALAVTVTLLRAVLPPVSIVTFPGEIGFFLMVSRIPVLVFPVRIGSMFSATLPVAFAVTVTLLRVLVPPVSMVTLPGTIGFFLIVSRIVVPVLPSKMGSALLVMLLTALAVTITLSRALTPPVSIVTLPVVTLPVVVLPPVTFPVTIGFCSMVTLPESPGDVTFTGFKLTL